jgi:hypothetical protein
MQVLAAGRRAPAARAQIARIGIKQAGRQVPLAEKTLRAVDIGEDGVEQARALNGARLDRAPFGFRDDERDEIERPGTLDALGLAIDGVADAVLPQQAARFVAQLADLAGIEGGQAIDQELPMRTDLSRSGDELVPDRAGAIAHSGDIAEQRGLRRCPTRPAGR